MTKTKYASYQEIEDSYNIPKYQVISLLSSHIHVFSFSENGIHYHPPFNITDKHSLLHAIQNAYPKGIRVSSLQLCYEFAISDCNQMIYENKADVLRFGKTNEKLVFAKHHAKKSIEHQWRKSICRTDNYPKIFTFSSITCEH